jgi:hypothetical protein
MELIMDEKRKAQAEQVFNSISLLLTEAGTVLPTIFMILKDETVMPIIAPQVPIKTLCSAAINAASEKDAEALMLICEQSILSLDKDDPRIEAYTSGLLKPSESEDSEDYLSLIYMSAEGECQTIMGKIHKDPAGVRYLRDHKWLDNAHTNVLVPWRTNELQYMGAKVQINDSEGE